MRNVNELSDREVVAIVKAIRDRAGRHGEQIRQGKDNTGSMGFMIVDASSNTITAGEGYTIPLDELAEMYNITF